MMKTLSQSPTNDLYIGSDGQLSVTSGRLSYADTISDTIRTLKGEIQLDASIGIDYMGTVFKSISRTYIWKHYVTTAINALPFVKSILSFDASYVSQSRTMNYSLSVSTDDGVVQVSS